MKNVILKTKDIMSQELTQDVLQLQIKGLPTARIAAMHFFGLTYIGKTMSERDIQKQILTYLELKGYMHWRNYVGPILRGPRKLLSKNPMAGMPDILGVFKSHHRLFAIEVKTPKGKLADKQKAWIEQLTNAGAYCLVARDISDVVEAFKIHDKV